MSFLRSNIETHFQSATSAGFGFGEPSNLPTKMSLTVRNEF